MALLTRDEFLKRRPLPQETITIDGFGQVAVRGLTGAERDRWEINLAPDRRTGKPKLENLRAKMVQLCVVDDKGSRLFEPSDIPEISQLSVAILQKIFEAAQRLSGFDEGEVEAAIKNSETTPANASGTA